MSKLHIYPISGSKLADGEGEISAGDRFTITNITPRTAMGEIQKGSMYKIAQGTHLPEGYYHCVGRRTESFEATFQKQADVHEGEFSGVLNALTMQTFLAAVRKVVDIQIASNDLTILKKNLYRLCFAKKVGDNDYNVVWQSYSQFLSNNTFSWTPQYQLFGTNTFKASIQVRAQTNVVTIGLGETSTLNEAGLLSNPVTGGPQTGFTMKNSYGSIHPGVNQLAVGIDGSQVSSPIYVAPNAAVMGDTVLTPVEKVLVWFQQDIETSTMFSDTRSNAVEIDLTDVNEATRRYENQKWIVC